VTAAERAAWLNEHVSKLQKRIERLMRVEARRRVTKCKKCDTPVDKAKEAAAEADKLERRVSRLLRAAAHIDAQEEKRSQRAKRLAKSKAPRDRAELVLGALDEMPVDLAMQTAEEALRRARARAGEAA
jgi:hypothetical protein